jgi:hypothetical protein
LIKILIFEIDNVLCESYWLYVTNGFSDFYKYENNLACEFSFRLKKSNQIDSKPDEWPIKMLQGLAAYSYNTGNLITCGDHIPLMICQNTKDSRFIKHALITDDLEFRENFSCNNNINLDILQVKFHFKKLSRYVEYTLNLFTCTRY